MSAPPAVIQTLLSAGAEVNAKDTDGITALHWAVLAHHADLVDILMAGGASVNATDRFGYTPLHYAASVDFGDAETAKALLRAGADPSVKEKEGKTASNLASAYPHIRAVFETAGAKP